MADDKKEPSTPHGEADGDTERGKKAPESEGSSESYGHEGPVETPSPAEKQPS